MEKKKFAIIIDSSTTYDENFIKKNDVFVIPLEFSDQNGKLYEDNKEFSHQKMLAELENGANFKTSFSNTGKFINLINKLLKQYEDIYFIPISYGVSGQYQTAISVIKNEFPKHFYTIKSSSGGLINEFAVYKLIELLKQKIMTPIDVVAMIEKYIEKNGEIFFIPNTIKGLIRSGRIGKLKGNIINYLRIKPILVCYAKIIALGKCINYKIGLEKIIKTIKKNYSPFNENDIEYLGVMETASESEQQKKYIIDTLSEAMKFDKKKIIIRKIPNVLLIHVWDGCFAVGIIFKNKERKKNYLSIEL